MTAGEIRTRTMVISSVNKRIKIIDVSPCKGDIEAWPRIKWLMHDASSILKIQSPVVGHSILHEYAANISLTEMVKLYAGEG